MAKILSDSLVGKGIAVYRYDDRGSGESTGLAETVTSFDTLAEEVYAAVVQLRQRQDIGAIGLCGHSLGGILSVMAASRHPDIDFIITLSGSFRIGGEIMMEQARTLKRWKTSSDMSDSLVIANGERFVRNWVSYSGGGEGLDTMKMILRDLIHYQIRKLPPEKLAQNLKTYKDTNELFEKSYEEVLGYYTSAHQTSFATYDPVNDFSKITRPVLVVFGEKDAHVVVESNRPALVKSLVHAKTMDFSYKNIPGVDHGYPSKELYKKGLIGPGVIDCLASWILSRFGPDYLIKMAEVVGSK
jgi:pimeloyl-ACP methyl ester carboxylesterase